MRRFLFLLLSGLLYSTGQAGIYRHDVPLAQYMDLAAQPQFDCIGMVLDRHMNLQGSCVLIGNRYVLSAAHVFIETDTRPETSYVDGRQVISYKTVSRHAGDAGSYSCSFKRRTYGVKSILLFPAYMASATSGQCDLALIELEEPVPDVVVPAIITATDAAVHDTLTGVGYGASGPANDPEVVGNWMEKIAGQNIIDTVGGYTYRGQPALLMVDFDHPTDQTCCNQLGSTTSLPLEYVPSGGDSGGGAFRHTAHGWELIGILSGGGVNVSLLLKINAYYGQQAQWTRIAPFRTWIRQHMAGR